MRRLPMILKSALCLLAAAAGPARPAIAGDVVVLVPQDGSEHGFGHAVALDGDTAVVGDPEFNNFGVGGDAYVFERDAGGPGNWGEVARLLPSDTADNDDFGSSLALQGDRLLVGAPGRAMGLDRPGRVYVFERDAGGGGEWDEVATLLADDGQPDEEVGAAVALDGDTAVAGAPGRDAAYVFERDAGGTWSQVAELVNPDVGGVDYFGRAVALDGDTIMVGSRVDDGVDSGRVDVFDRDTGGPGAWGHVTTLRAPEPAGLREFGAAIDLEGDRAVFGEMISFKYTGSEPPASYLFERGPGGPGDWSLAATLAGDFLFEDEFGAAVALAGDLAVVGAPEHLAGRGAARAFSRDAGGADHWGLGARLAAPDAALGWEMGRAISVAGLEVLVGAPGPASAYLFDLATFGPLAEADGECPGAVTVEIAAAAPNSTVGLAGSRAEGTSVLPDGPCAGTELGLDRPRHLGTFTTDALGNASLEVELGEAPCGGYVQAVAQSTCLTSNVARLPQPRVALRYDPGTPADFFAESASSIHYSLGNVFDTALGTPLAGGSLSAVRAYQRRGPYVYTNLELTVWPGPPEAGAEISALAFLRMPFVGAGSTFNTYVLAEPLPVDPGFMIGQELFLDCYFGCFSGGDLGMRSDTSAGQGFHGFRMEARLGIGEEFERLDANAMLRAYGRFGAPLLPVELARDPVEP